MAKKKNTFGKLLAFTTTAIAIGGTFYIFRDKIKQSSVYKTVSEKLSDIFGGISEKFSDHDDDDFFFDEEDDDFEDAFSKDTEHGREYTSITINAKEEAPKEQDFKNTPDSEGENLSERNDVKPSGENPFKNDAVNPSEEGSSKNDAVNPSRENSSKNDNADPSQASPDGKDDTTKSGEAFSNEDLIEIFPKDSISNIKVGNTSGPANSVSEGNTSSTEENHYENEGLSDVSEDSDTLEDQDKLDI